MIGVLRARARVCVCVYMRVRARARVCVCVRVCFELVHLISSDVWAMNNVLLLMGRLHRYSHASSRRYDWVGDRMKNSSHLRNYVPNMQS